MNKLFTKIAGTFLGLSMAIGVGVAASSVNREVKPSYAATESITLDFATAGYTSFASGSVDQKIKYTYEKGTGTSDPVFTKASGESQYSLKLYANNYLCIEIDSTGSSSYSSFSSIQIWATSKNGSTNGSGVYYKDSLSSTALYTHSLKTASFTAGDETSVNSASKIYIKCGSGQYRIGKMVIKLNTASADPVISNVELSKGNPTASEVKAGGVSWTMAATVTTTPANDTTLSRNVNWSCSPSGAVTFSKTTSASAEDITVTAVNTARESVTITATSAQTSSKFATSNSFSISKSYNVNTNTLVTKDGESAYSAGGATSKAVTFTSTMTYSGDAGEYHVGVSVSPNSGVTYNSSLTSSSSGQDFDVTFTKDGTYTITTTPVENSAKAASVTITISGIVVPGYELVNSSGGLVNNAKYIIYCSSNSTAMGSAGEGSKGGRTDISVTESDGFIASSDVPNTVGIVTLKNAEAGNGYNLQLDEDKYLAIKTTASGELALVDDDDEEFATGASWTITFTGNDASINNVAFSTMQLQSNKANGTYMVYAGTQYNVQLYKLKTTDPYFTISDAQIYLGPRGTHTLTLTAHNNASDTVTWSTGNAAIASIPASSTGMSVTVTGVAEGTTSITATFGTPSKYEALSCTVQVLGLQPYVNVGVSSFTKISTKPSEGWEGTYLIGDQAANTLFNGGLSPLPGGGNNYATLESLGDSVTATTDIITKSFTIKAGETEGTYTIRSNSYYYIGNKTTENGMNTSIVESYEVSISDAGVITMNSTTLCFNNGSSKMFRFYKASAMSETIRAISLWKADGEVREITNTIASWYDNAKENEYLVCNEDTTKSKINWSSLSSGNYYTALTSTDKDTLKRMSSKSAEDSGNYLEDFISDYDFLVQYKGYTDFLERFEEGGAMYGASRVVFAAVNNSNIPSIILVISVASITAIGGYFLLKKKKEQ